MCDHDERAVPAGERLFGAPLGGGIEVASRFVEHDHRSGRQVSAHQSDQLTLARGELGGHDLGVMAAQSGHPLAGTERGDGVLHFTSRGGGPEIGQVRQDRAGEDV